MRGHRSDRQGTKGCVSTFSNPSLLAEEECAPTTAGPVVAQLRDALKVRLMQMEEALFVASGQRFEAESEAAAEATFLAGIAAPPPSRAAHSCRKHGHACQI